MNFKDYTHIHVATHIGDDYHTVYLYSEDKAYYWNSIKDSKWAKYGLVERSKYDRKFEGNLKYYKFDTRYVIVK